MKGLNATALFLIIVGAINWLLVGLIDFNLVAAIFGLDTIASNIIYVIVGIAGLYALALFPLVSRSYAETHHHREPART